MGVCAACSGGVCTCHVNILKPVFRTGGHRKVSLWRWSLVLGGSPASPRPGSAETGSTLLPVSPAALHPGALHCLGPLLRSSLLPVPRTDPGIKCWGPPAPHIRVAEPGFAGSVSGERRGAHTPLKSAAASSKVRTQKAVASSLPLACSLGAEDGQAPAAAPFGPQPLPVLLCSPSSQVSALDRHRVAGERQGGESPRSSGGVRSFCGQLLPPVVRRAPSPRAGTPRETLQHDPPLSLLAAPPLQVGGRVSAAPGGGLGRAPIMWAPDP